MNNRRFLKADELTRTTNCPELPLVLEREKGSAISSSEDFSQLLTERRNEIREEVLKYGGVLFRGFPLEDAVSFQSAVEALGYEPACDNPMDTSPRHNVADRVFTSTDAPDGFPILAHNENCFLNERPKMISFFCETEPLQYGETPVFDSRAAFETLSDSVRDKLSERNVLYRRRMPKQRRPWAPNIMRTWQESFGTEDQSEIEEITSDHGLTCKWHPGGRLLHTEVVVDPLPYHPDTNQQCLNIQGFHRSSIMLDIQEVRSRQNRIFNSLVKTGTGFMYQIDSMPVTIQWGDGSPISHPDMVEMRSAIWNNSVLFHWRKGDFLLLDNFLTAHGRMNVVQPRRILTAFSDFVTIP